MNILNLKKKKEEKKGVKKMLSIQTQVIFIHIHNYV